MNRNEARYWIEDEWEQGKIEERGKRTRKAEPLSRARMGRNCKRRCVKTKWESMRGAGKRKAGRKVQGEQEEGV